MPTLTWKDRFEDQIELEIADLEDEDDGTELIELDIVLPLVMWQEIVAGKGTQKKFIDWLEAQVIEGGEADDDEDE